MWHLHQNDREHLNQSDLPVTMQLNSPIQRFECEDEVVGLCGKPKYIPLLVLNRNGLI